MITTLVLSLCSFQLAGVIGVIAIASSGLRLKLLIQIELNKLSQKFLLNESLEP